MIEIKISEVLYSENPNNNSIKRTDLEKFLDGFKQLCNKTNMHNITIAGYASIPTELKFDDGTSIGIGRLFKEIGFK